MKIPKKIVDQERRRRQLFNKREKLTEPESEELYQLTRRGQERTLRAKGWSTKRIKDFLY